MAGEPPALSCSARGLGSALPSRTEPQQQKTHQLLCYNTPGQHWAVTGPGQHSPPAGGRAQIQQHPGLLQELELPIELEKLEGGAGPKACGMEKRGSRVSRAQGYRRHPQPGPAPLTRLLGQVVELVPPALAQLALLAHGGSAQGPPQGPDPPSAAGWDLRG